MNPLGNFLSLGLLPGSDKPLILPPNIRDKHLYVCGGTGTGKSKFLESLIRQDIANWRKSKCGLLVIDPHGSLYDSLIHWMAWNKNALQGRPFVPIDLRQDEWVVSYNLLRQRPHADTEVLVDGLTEAIAHVWGQSGLTDTPRFARWAKNVLRPLYDSNLTLVEAELMMDVMRATLRRQIAAGTTSEGTRQDWNFADALNERDFDTQVGSTVNRLRPFIDNATLRTMFGIRDVSLDLGRALEEGHIILVNLATERAKISQENARLFASLLISDLWTAAKERGKPGDGSSVKPFYVFCDEFQTMVTPTIAQNLDQARGFGLHLTLANQFPRQIINSGPHGQAVYDSIMENASSKVCFRLTSEDNLMPLAKWLFMRVVNPDEIKHELYSTKVMEYREEIREIRSAGHGTGSGTGRQRGRARGAGTGGTQNFIGDDTTNDPTGVSLSQSDFASDSESESASLSEAFSESVSYVPTLVPVLGKELSHVQFRSLEEQVFRSMAVLFDLQERHAVCRLAGMKAPASIRTPTIESVPGSPEYTKKYLESVYKSLSFALPGADARAKLLARAEGLAKELLANSPEPKTARRQIRG